MPRLDPNERAVLPDRAFAYIDAGGRRRLPIHDAAHVRNALARFGQVGFEDEQARERARMRLLNAAKRFKIVPIGFIAGQLQSERALVPRARAKAPLPSGFVTMLMTDIEGSTGLVNQLGERYEELINDVWSTLRRCVRDTGGHEVEARADEFFAAFEAPRAAVDAAVSVQHDLLGRIRSDGLSVRVRIGIHSGYPKSTENNYIGIDVNMASRICAVGHGGQIVVSANTREAVKASAPDGIRFKTLGSHRLRGVPDAPMLYQVASKGLPTTFPALRKS
jgi:class 3 adenylate cyclase